MSEESSVKPPEEFRDEGDESSFSSLSTRIVVEEPLLFEISGKGKRGVLEFKEDLRKGYEGIPSHLLRKNLSLPQLSEVEVVRHFHRLSQQNYSIDEGIFPLGSCTMKYNPRFGEKVSTLPSLLHLHPLLDEDWVQGALEIYYTLEQYLCMVCGMSAFTLIPSAGAHGELTALLMVSAYFRHKGENRTVVLVPDPAHGTTPASASMGGFVVKELPSDSRGILTRKVVESALTEEVACLMVTNPNTLGFYEEEICEIAEVLHKNGSLLYMDGANMNALLGLVRPGDLGVDLLHLNLHKTFSTPHGGGGPGSGPVGVKESLIPFLPVPRVRKEGDRYFLWEEEPLSIGKVKGFYGHFGMIVRALSYLLSLGGEGIREVARRAILHANYLRVKLKEDYYLPYDRPVMHEVVFTHKYQKERGVSALDIGKRMLDKGVHPPTVAFPLVVSGALMIEPTETEPLAELDRLIKVLKEIAREVEEDPQKVKEAPFHTFRKRLNEVMASRKPILTYRHYLKERSQLESPESLRTEKGSG